MRVRGVQHARRAVLRRDRHHPQADGLAQVVLVWFWFAIGYQCVFAWCVGLIINQLWELFVLGNFSAWTVVAFVLLAGMIFQIARPMPKTESTSERILPHLA